MKKSAERAFCLGLVLFAALIRLLCAMQALPEPADEPGVLTLRIASADPASVPQTPVREVRAVEVPMPLCFSAAEAGEIPVGGACSYSFDKAALLTQRTTLDFSGDGPKVLIVHTHSSEAYTQEAGFEYTPSDPLRTEDARCSVIRVGQELAERLNEAGIETLHDSALNDYPNYNGAYERIRQTISAYLAEYPSIQMVLDVHRDAASDASGAPAALSSTQSGERCAQLMLVVGTDQGGLSHPDWQENLANALKLQALLNRSAPGLCRALDLRTERFNQHLTPGSLLIEFGSTGNTLTEALRSARIFADALSAFILAGQAEPQAG